MDAIFDSVSIATTIKETLAKQGIIFCSMSEAIRDYPELVRKYLGSVVPYTDNFYATLNSAVFSDGSFCYIPKGVRCPMELTTYFRINAENTGQFERTLIIADEGSYVSYLEGCSAPMRDENQLHAAVVELVTLDDAEIKYSTIQNWYPGDENGVGGIYNFVTKRASAWAELQDIVDAGGDRLGDHLEVPRRAPSGRQLHRRVLLGGAGQGPPAGRYGYEDDPHRKNTRSTVIAKGISAGQGQNTYRGLVRVMPSADNTWNFTQCDSLLIGDRCGAHTTPYVEVRNTRRTWSTKLSRRASARSNSSTATSAASP